MRADTQTSGRFRDPTARTGSTSPTLGLQSDIADSLGLASPAGSSSQSFPIVTGSTPGRGAEKNVTSMSYVADMGSHEYTNMIISTVEDFEGVANHLIFHDGRYPHWIVVTSPAHRITDIRGAATLEQLFRQTAGLHINDRRFAIASAESALGSEDMLAVEHRFRRLARRKHACWFDWTILCDVVDCAHSGGDGDQ